MVYMTLSYYYHNIIYIMAELADHSLYYMHDIINELTSYYVNVQTIIYVYTQWWI